MTACKFYPSARRTTLRARYDKTAKWEIGRPAGRRECGIDHLTATDATSAQSASRAPVAAAAGVLTIHTPAMSSVGADRGGCDVQRGRLANPKPVPADCTGQAPRSVAKGLAQPDAARHEGRTPFQRGPGGRSKASPASRTSNGGYGGILERIEADGTHHRARLAAVSHGGNPVPADDALIRR